MLDISPILLLSSAVVFLLVLARLNSCLYKPLLKHMDDRDSQIKADLENAKNNGSDVEGMLEEAKSIIAQAKKEALSIRETARTEAVKVSDSKLSKARADLEAKYVEFSKDLENEKTALNDALNSQMNNFKDSLNSKLSTI